MYYLHETHAVIGEHETAFEHHFRDAYLGKVAEDDDARLLWYLDSTHGAGEGYKVVTIIGFASLDAWERHVMRLLEGDLAEWMRRADELRYSAVGNVLVDAEPVAEPIVLASVPVDGREHDRALVRQDLLWPADGEDLVESLGVRVAEVRGTESDGDLVRFERAFVPALAGIEAGQVVLVHRILDPQRWIEAWPDDVVDWTGGLGALPGEARREVRVLRTASWSPLS